MSAAAEHRRMWCMVVAKLVSPGFPVEANRALLDMLPALSHMPDAVFTDDSARHVAGCKRREQIPNFRDIKEALGEYRSTYVAEDFPRLPPPDVPEVAPPTQAEIAAVAAKLGAWRAEQESARQAACLAVPAEPQAYAFDPRFRGAELRGVQERRAAEVLRRQRLMRGIGQPQHEPEVAARQADGRPEWK